MQSLRGHSLSQFHLTAPPGQRPESPAPRSHQGQDGTTVYLLVSNSEEKQLELCVGLKEASKCQELGEMEGRAQREEPRGALAMGIAWEDHGGLWK